MQDLFFEPHWAIVRFPNGYLTCVVCGESFMYSFVEDVHRLECGDLYHAACLKAYIGEQLDNMALPVRCANEKCFEAMTSSEIFNLLSKEQQRRYTIEEEKLREESSTQD